MMDAALRLGRSRLSEVEAGRHNNLNLIRFVLASGVIFSHSYPILHSFASEPWAQFSRSTGSIGDLAVLGFFFLSGYLISKSAVRNPDPVIFLRSRMLRIGPALGAAVCLLVFVLGPALTSKTLTEYFHSPATYHYLLTGILNHNAGLTLPGVFERNAISEVNLPLWTLSSEWTMYFLALLVMLALRGQSFIRNLHASAWVMLGIALLVTSQMFPLPWMYSLRWGLAFLAGGLVYAFRQRILLSIPVAAIILSVDLTLVRLAPHIGKPLLPFALFYFLLVVGFHPKLHVAGFHKFGDMSYGLYIYAWPIQQLLAPKFNWPPALFFASYILVIPIAATSWHLLEKRCLSLKHSSGGVREAKPHPVQVA